MLSFSRRLIYALSNRVFRIFRPAYGSSQYDQSYQDLDEPAEEKLAVDFSKTRKSPFPIKSESSYNAYLSKGAFELALKKQNFVAWLEIPGRVYQDHVIEAKISLDSFGGYAASGILFHIRDESSYYMALVSSKGYFRVDLIKDDAPKPLIAWTEFTEFDGSNFELKIITYGTYLIFLVNGRWIGEVNDDSLRGGNVGFALASYIEDKAKKTLADGEVSCKAALKYLSVDPGIKTVENNFKFWSDESNVNAENRLRLAETYAVMGDALKAMDQITKAWKRRDEAIRSIATAHVEEVRTKRELLLAARMSMQIGQYVEAEEFINTILEQWRNTPEGKEAIKEKLRVLHELGRFAELKDFMLNNAESIKLDIEYYSSLAGCYYNLKEYENSALAWDKVFELNAENGVYPANAAAALELAGKNEEALAKYLEAGKIFLRQDNLKELSVIIPKLTALGFENWEARVLTGKWAFSIEDYEQCLAEFSAGNKLRIKMRPRPKGDPAHYYLWGLVLSLQGKNYNAIKMLARAVKLAPDYGLFRFKLVEFKINNGDRDPRFADELKKALLDIGDDPKGKMAELAGNLLIRAGDKKSARYFLERANS
jgi:tetratricopeptide (TPR) repeat protein